MITWKDKVVIVTGAAAGIGAATAALFCERGAAVVMADLDAGAVVEGARGLAARGRRALGVGADVSAEKDVAVLTDVALKSFGRIDALVNNAGILRRHDRIEDSPLDEFRRIVDVNLTSMFITAKAVAPHMGRAGGGVMVNIASVGGIVAVPYSPAYAAAKAGVLGLTRTLAVMLREHHVRVNAILPMLVDTPMTKDSPASVAAMQPGGKLKPNDIARGILYAASAETLNSAFIVVNNSEQGAWLSQVQDPPAQTKLSVEF
jgi:3alpha(or 20beta)-hydroxysteroid dehydrogenase